MRRAAVAALCTIGLTFSTIMAPAPAVAAPAAPPALSLPAPIPPSLKAIEASLATLQLSSVRESLRTDTTFAHGAGKGIAKLLALFAIRLEGVETVAPEAAAIKLVLFGSHLRIREVEGHIYFYSYLLGLRDGGRPWVRLGTGQLGKLLNTGHAKPDPANAGQRFSQLITLINEGKDIRELGPSTIDGQSVLGFAEEPELSAGSEEGTSGLFGGFTASRRRKVAIPPSHLTLQAFFAASGMPVRVILSSATGPATTTLTAEFPAINFPFTVPAPPPAQVIGEATLEALGKRGRLSGGGHRRKR